MYYWTDIVKGFCESAVVPPPEYVNSFSAIAITMFGLFGVFMSRYNSIPIRLISASLIFNGISSFVFHWTLFRAWGILDAISMLFPVYLGVYLILDVILYRKFYVEYSSRLTSSDGSPKGRRKYEIISSLFAIFVVTMLNFSVTIKQFEQYDSLFSVLFVIPELLILIGVFVIRYYSHKHLTQEYPGFKFAFRKMYVGVIVSLLSGAAWFSTELICEQHPWVRFFFAHAIWHVGMSFGMYNLLMFLIFIHLYDKGHEPEFFSGYTMVGKIFYFIVPVVIRAVDSGETLIPYWQN